jgi:hypothetical protein
MRPSPHRLSDCKRRKSSRRLNSSVPIINLALSSKKQSVSKLCATLEYEPVDDGPLINACIIEPVAELNIQFGCALGWSRQFAPAWVRL